MTKLCIESDIGISTLFTGYNFGSALQAYATKLFLRSLGYTSVLFKVKGSLIRGRDVRLKKSAIILLNALRYRDKSKIAKYKKSLSKQISEETIALFNAFYDNYLEPTLIRYRELKKLAKKPSFKAFICGSDQIWDSTALYVDPFYYLSFAPRDKRIAFAPSFGHDYVPKYNVRKLCKKINGIKYLSIREKSGQNLLKDVFDKESIVLLDPTLLIERQEWINELCLNVNRKEEPYVLAYFLDNPSDKAKKVLDYFVNNGYNVKSICSRDNGINAGPKEFLQYLLCASYVCTDSFHGVAFSINFGKQFFVFQRDYGNGENQSTRIESMLETADLLDRFDSDIIQDIEEERLAVIQNLLNKEREKAKHFLCTAINQIGNLNNEK